MASIANEVTDLFQSLGFERIPSTEDSFHIQYVEGFLLATVKYENGVIATVRQRTDGSFSDLTSFDAKDISREARGRFFLKLKALGLSAFGISMILGIPLSMVHNLSRESKNAPAA